MNSENRTDQQLRAYFLFQEFIAQEMVNQWITLDKLVVRIQPRPTKQSLHEIFKAILESMYWKMSTKEMTQKEMNDTLDVYMEALQSIGVHLEFPDRDKQNLLQFYK